MGEVGAVDLGGTEIICGLATVSSPCFPISTGR